MRNLVLLSFTVLLFSCRGKESVFSGNLEYPRVAFAVQTIKASEAANPAVNENPVEYIFHLDEGRTEDESYSVECTRNKVQIRSGSLNGLMYGGFEVAEQIQLYGSVKNTSHTPYIKKRGIKFNIPLDARTPSYDDTGDAAQNNIEHMWDWEFWQEYLDQLALNRYNVLTLWNPHPFPSMIRQDAYPEVALDDVCVTTLSPTGKENEWAEPQMVSSNVMENLKVVKEMGIDEKIAFWQRVMQYADDRGIELYFFTWNICPNSVARPVPPFYKTVHIKLDDEEAGKHGVTNQQHNPLTVAYYRDAVRTFLLTYPLVKGIGVTAGEHMNNQDGAYSREQWIWEAYGLGILDAKEEQPDREVDFIHRVWNTKLDKIVHYWSNYPDSFEASFKYARARLYSTPTPDFAAEHIEAMKHYGLKSWWNLRNDDIFVHRWGDPDYVQEFIAYLDKENTSGFYMGSDGYVWGREFNSINQELAGQLEIEKHWYRFMMWGRLAFNNSLDQDFFMDKLAQRYPGTDAEILYHGLKTASGIIPAVNRFHWNSWDYQWSVEACIDVRNGFHDVIRFMETPVLEGSGMLNPLAYAKARTEEQEINGVTPFDAALELRISADETLDFVRQLQGIENSTELNALLDDMRSVAFLGRYYSSKIKAATELALYSESGNSSNQDNAVALLQEAAGYFEQYGNILKKNYRPQMLARTGNFDCDEILVEVRKDIDLAQQTEYLNN